MKVFLQILLYLICSECRIEDNPPEQVPYTNLGSTKIDDTYRTHPPIILKDLSAYTSFYLDFYGAYPDYTDFDFTKNMIVVFFASTSGSIEIENIYETNDQISIHMVHPKIDNNSPRINDCQIHMPLTYMISVGIKQSNKNLKAYG